MSRVRNLKGDEYTVSLNAENTVGIQTLDGRTTNQTRRTQFNTEYLVEWANAVHEAYEGHVEVVFTPDYPMAAVKASSDAKLGICVAPMVRDQ